MRFIHKNPLHYYQREDGHTVMDGRRFAPLGPMILQWIALSQSWTLGLRAYERFAVLRDPTTRWPTDPSKFIPMRRTTDPGFSEIGSNGGGWRTFAHSQWRPDATRLVENEYVVYAKAINVLLGAKRQRLVVLMKKLLKDPSLKNPAYNQALNVQKEINRLLRWKRAKRKIYIGRTGDYNRERLGLFDDD